jgi:uncharacterized delta-60 repeat protein
VKGFVVAVVVLGMAYAASTAQAATLVSETTWGGAGSESVGDAVTAPDGSTYLAGFTSSFADGQNEILVLKFDSDGNPAWQRTWDGPEQFGNDQATDVDVAPDGSVYVTGQTIGTGGDVVLLKFTPAGELVWQRRWGGAMFERGEAVAVGADGAVYVTGGTTSFSPGTESDLFVLRFLPDGSLEWQRLWQSTDFEEGQGVDVGPAGTISVGGVATRPGGNFEFDAVLLGLGSDGSLDWQRAYSTGEIADFRGGVAVDSGGAVYAAGAIQDARRKLVVDATLVKFAPDGSLEWDRSWGGRSGDVSAGVAVAPNGDALWSGDTNSYGAGSDDAFLLRLSPAGRTLDAATWGGAGVDHGNGVDEGPSGVTSLGATAQDPPYALADAPAKTSRLRGTVSTPATPLTNAAGTVADPAGTTATPPGTSPGPGNFDAALVRVGP